MSVTGPAASGADGAWRPLRPSTPLRPPRPFRSLARTHAFAMGGDTLVTMALAGSVFFSISPNDARGRVALSLLLTMAPFAVVAPFLGPAIDRTRKGRRAMVIASCVGRAAACVVMARVLDRLLLFPVAFSVLVLSKAYSVAKSSLVPAAVRSDDELVEANSKLAITGVLAGFVVAAPGVALLQLLSADWALGLAAVLFVGAAAAGLRLPTEAPAARPAAAGSAAGAGAAVEGGRTGETDLRLAAAAVAMALLRAQVGFLTFLVAFGFRRTGAPSWWFGVVLAASMAATLGGNAVAPRLRDRVPEERILAGGLALVAIVGLGLGRLEGRMWAAAMAAAVGVAAGTSKLAFDALVQRDAPGAERGRSFARFEAGFQLVWVFGALLPVLVTTPLRQGYDVLGIAALAAATVYVVTERRLGTSVP